MKPGRELDALVAEKVMGWGVCRDVECTGCECPVILVATTLSTFWRTEKPSNPGVEWRPSTDIAAAWEVVEKMEADGWRWTADRAPPSSYAAYAWRFHRGPEVFRADSDTAPHAICLAALRAVGVEVDDG